MNSRLASIRAAWSRGANASPRDVTVVSLALLALLLQPHVASARAGQQAVAPIARLETLLNAADSAAVEEAGRIGPSALSLIRGYIKHENYRSRQLAMRCAGRIGVDQGADILAAGLADENINVQNAAANELARKAWPGAASAILAALTSGTDTLIKERLALAAGYLPGARSLEVLKPIAKGNSVLAVNARMALARLHDQQASRTLIAELSAPSPRVRYDALEKLIYVNDRSYAPRVKQSLTDKAKAIPVGIVERARFRRVCDQAVDTLVSLLQVAAGFPVGPDKIYSDEEIRKLTAAIK